jgi:hypothetical protein
MRLPGNVSQRGLRIDAHDIPTYRGDISRVHNLHRASDRESPDAYGGSEAGVFDCQSARVLNAYGTGGGCPLL